MRLIVKGTKAEAIAAAAARGIPLRVLETTADDSVSGDAPDTCVTAALLWFVEPVPAVPGKGFPAGSLLYYTHGHGA